MSGRDALAPAVLRGEEIARLHALPSPHGVAYELMRLALRDDVSVAQLARLARADPALAGRLIKAANAPALGARRPTASLSEAILRLGVPTVRQLAAAFSLLERYARGPCAAFDYRRFWTESLLRGLAAQTLAARLRLAAPEEAFTCGLLAHVGRLGLATAYPAEYAALLAAAPDADDALRATERARFALDHATLSVAMLESWRFPPPLLEAIEAHFAPQAPRRDEASRIARLAQLLSLAQHIARSGAEPRERRSERSAAALLEAARLGVDAEALEALAAEVERHAEDWAPLLGLPAPRGPLVALAAQEPAAPARADAASPRALLLETADGVWRSVRELLAADGVPFVGVRTLAEALASAASAGLGLVLADCRVADADPPALARALRAAAGAQPMHLVLLADAATLAGALAAMEAGADDVLCAPCDPRLLQARLRAGLRAVRREAERARDAEAIRRFASELALNNRRLHQAALTDPLTGIPNRRYALARLEQECAAARRRGAPLACLAVDLDHFKRVNDEHGHEAGDAALVEVARALRAAARLQDSVCRLGGEEFVVLLPDTGAREARLVAERLRSAVAALAHRTPEGVALALTVSIGVAAEEPCRAAPAELLRRADAALRAAKREGRNRIREG
ncbi:MAG: diguanylate cyclase [Burkholderiales bacterium]|nr:diguanylate cyclase [Burkholderiales bacterium]